MELNEILKVKIQGDGYILNDIMSVPKADGNREYELIKQWLAEGNTPEPEFTEAELAQQAVDKKIAEAKAYLASTDWVEPYLIKHYTGLEVIEADSNKFVIEAKRAEARVFLKEQGL